MVVGGPCVVRGCRSSSLYGSDKCYKHKDIHEPHLYSVGLSSSDNPETNEIGPDSDQRSGSEISYNIDGDDFTVPSKNMGDMFESLTRAKKFWTVDLGLDDDEFVQYAIVDGEFEHWDDREMLESKEMEQDHAIRILRHKLTGQERTSGLWWGENDTSVNNVEVNNDDEQNSSLFSLLGVFVIIIIIVVIASGDSDIIASMVGEGCVELICGGAIALGGGAAALGRSEEGRFE